MKAHWRAADVAIILGEEAEGDGKHQRWTQDRAALPTTAGA